MPVGAQGAVRDGGGRHEPSDHMDFPARYRVVSAGDEPARESRMAAQAKPAAEHRLASNTVAAAPDSPQ